MACRPFVIRDGDGKAVGGGFACGGRRAAPCDTPGCNTPHVALCDWPLDGKAKGRTCDRKMCGTHRHNVGPDRDYCAPHFRAHQAPPPPPAPVVPCGRVYALASPCTAPAPCVLARGHHEAAGVKALCRDEQGGTWPYRDGEEWTPPPPPFEELL